MNTQFKLNRKAALAAGILSAAIWVPLAAQAQDLPNTTGHSPGTNMRTDYRSHHRAMHDQATTGACRHSSENPAYLPEFGFGNALHGAGFAETDPASPFTPDSIGSSHFADANVRIRLIPAGFAETDPAALSPMVDLSISMDVPGQMQRTLVGFAETDPAAEAFRAGLDMQSRHLAVCPHVNGELTVHGVPGTMSAGRIPGRS